MNSAKEFIKKHILGVDNEWESRIENIFCLLGGNINKYLPENMLDVGCGDGARTLSLTEYFKKGRKNLYGLDYVKSLDISLHLRSPRQTTQSLNFNTFVIL